MQLKNSTNAIFFLVLSWCLSFNAYTATDSDEPVSYTLELPVYDYPFNQTLDLLNPSMSQSLYFSRAYYQTGHYLIQNYWSDKPYRAYLSVLLFDFLSTWMPLSSTWLHEEWHRAVMGQYDINSYNDVYDLEFFSEAIAVSEVDDNSLIDLKKNHPADMIRLHSAGLEAQNELNLLLAKDRFFHNVKTRDNLVILFNTLNSIAYLGTCASSESNKITRDFLNQEGSDISSRDFTGLDCNAWTYDLFRPDEPYEARGDHPSGVGIKRYISYGQLNSSEQNYLKEQFYLSFLNVLNPFLFNRRYFNATSPINGKPFLWNMALAHTLTPFGNVINVNVFLMQNTNRLFFALHTYSNRHSHFPGLSVQLIDSPMRLFHRLSKNTLSISLWQQPKDHSFTSGTSKPGAHLSFKSKLRWNKFLYPFIEIEHKTSGWLAGNVYLQKQTGFKAGVAIPIM